jgi:ATP-dependent DNA ligase
MVRSSAWTGAAAQFYDVLHRRRPAVFVAFDILRRGTGDLRYLPLADRKPELRRILDRKAHRMMYAEHIMAAGGPVRPGLQARSGRHRRQA